ncbi:MAG: PAS domain S-box protein [Actinomycetota bacterium]|nr:PAS domain S-box protein [Actinomycetota bacterium]
MHKEFSKSREKVVHMFETLPDGIVVIDRYARIASANTAAERLLGLKRNEIIGRTLEDVLLKRPLADESSFPETDDPLTQVFEAGLLASGVDHAYERPDGTSAVLSTNTALLHSKNGTPEGAVLSLRDVTERRREEEELKFRSLLLDSALDSMIVHDLEGKMIYINEAAYKTRGYTREELMTMSLLELEAPEYASLTRSRMKFLEKIGSASFESAHLKRDGTVMPVEVNARVVEFEGRIIVINIVRDITERKRAEEALKATERRLRDIASALGEGVYELDINGRVIFMNPAAERLLGWPAEELLGNDLHETIHRKRADGTRVLPEECHILEINNSGGVYRTEADVFTRKDGTTFTVSYISTPVIEDKRVVGSVTAFQDITERKRMEEELERRREQEKQIYADAMAAVTGGQFMLCAHENIGDHRRGRVVFSHDVTKPEEIHPVRALLDLYLLKRGVNIGRKYEIQIAATEALGNIVKYAAGGRIEIRADEVLQIEVVDSGPGINFAMLPRSVLMLGFSTKGTLGFGFTIMLEFADHLYLATGPAGTTIILEFQWNGRAR